MTIVLIKFYVLSVTYIYSNLTGFRKPVRFQPVSHNDSLEAKSEKQNVKSIYYNFFVSDLRFFVPLSYKILE